MMWMNILEVRDLKKEFYMHQQNKEIFSCQEINFDLKKGKFIGIIGRSGAGKSTILRCIYRTYLPTAGKIHYYSKSMGWIDLARCSDQDILDLRNQEIGYVSQFLSILPRTTALEHVTNAALEAGFEGTQASQLASEMLTYFRLPENLWDLFPNTFSGGERLRLNLAHGMIKKPQLLLLDEPTASLDPQTKLLVRDLLMKLKQEGTSMIGIFHDLEFMDGLCDQVFNISEGTFVS